MLAAVAIVPFQPAALVVIVIGLVMNLAIRGLTVARIGVVLGSFRQIGPLIAAAQAIAQIELPASDALRALERDVPRLRRLQRIARWVSRDPLTNGELITSGLEYLNLLFLLDELFRGTNAVERIAAAEAVLEELLFGGRPHIVIAATHDLELVDLLRERYEPFHFEDALDAEGLTFTYRLARGPATTRNAIALLELNGAPAALIQRALTRAAELDRQRGVAAAQPPGTITLS